MKRWDVIVVGAGPAGSAAAALLSDLGHRVLVLEKEHFPRFHIGESLLPLGTGVMERLGIEPTADTFLFKRGAQFICETTNRELEVSFDEAFDGPPRHAWQVERASFDTMLRDRAVSAGATVQHGEHVNDVTIDEDGVRVKTAVDTYAGRYLIDATGQGRLMARRAKAIKPFKEFGVAAAFQHFDDVDADLLGDHGDIRIMMRPEGWGWVIPLPNRRLSIGVVTQKRGVTAEMIEDYAAASPLIRAWTAGAEATAPRLIGNYAYKNEASNGLRYTCIGDAACFLDPVFSSGVSLALASAEKVSNRLAPALAEGRESDPALMTTVSADMKSAYAAFASLISRFYNTKLVSNLFLEAPPQAELRRGIVSVLAGDVWREDNPFQNMLARSRRVAPVA